MNDCCKGGENRGRKSAPNRKLISICRPVLESASDGHSMGTVEPEAIGNKNVVGRTSDVQSEVRLLDLHSAAAYLGVSYWSARDYVVDGILPVVKLPCGRRRKDGLLIRKAGDRETRRILIDRRDLDELIRRSKEGGLRCA